MTALLLYLESPRLYRMSDLAMRNQGELISVAEQLYSRLFKNAVINESILSDDEEDNEPAQKKSKQGQSKADELDAFLRATQKEKNRKVDSDCDQDINLIIRREMTVFEQGKKRPPTLALLHRALLTIPPTSVESERAFSALGNFVSKKRCRLEDESINELCFLKSYFLRKEKENVK